MADFGSVCFFEDGDSQAEEAAAADIYGEKGKENDIQTNAKQKKQTCFL